MTEPHPSNPAPTYPVRLTINQMRLIASWAELRQAQLQTGLYAQPKRDSFLITECGKLAAIIQEHLKLCQT